MSEHDRGCYSTKLSASHKAYADPWDFGPRVGESVGARAWVVYGPKTERLVLTAPCGYEKQIKNGCLSHTDVDDRCRETLISKA